MFYDEKILSIIGILLLLMGGCTYGMYKLVENQINGLINVAIQLNESFVECATLLVQ
jgi:hypothetical protein